MLRAVLATALLVAAHAAHAAEAPEAADAFAEGTPTAVSDFPGAARAGIMKLAGDHVILDSHVTVVKGKNTYTALIMARGGDSYTNLQITLDAAGKELARKLIRDPDAPKLVKVERKDGKRIETYDGGQTIEVTEDEVDAAMAKAAEQQAEAAAKPEAPTSDTPKGDAPKADSAKASP